MEQKELNRHKEPLLVYEFFYEKFSYNYDFHNHCISHQVVMHSKTGPVRLGLILEILCFTSLYSPRSTK